MRVLILAVICIALIQSVHAEFVTESSSTSSAGTTFSATWGQGCLAQDVSLPGFGTTSTQNHGPNQCAVSSTGTQLSPYYCPTDSAGTSSELVQQCDYCGCPTGFRCESSTDECAACPPLSPCQPGQVDGRRPAPTASDPCRTIGSCTWPVIDYRLTLTMSKCFLFCNEQSQTYTGNVRYVGDSDRYGLYYTVAGANSCYLEVEVTHEGDGINCRETDRWGSCGFGWECEAQQAYVETGCTNSGASTPHFEDFFSLARGSSTTRSYSCSIGWTYTEYEVDVSRSSTGTVSCSAPRVTYTTGGTNTPRVYECK